MRRTISLDGDWERRDFLDEAWRWSDALRGPADAAATDGPPVQAGVSAGWRRGSVPGSTVDDAWRAGEIPNPYVDRDSLAAEWVPERTWLYRRSFTLPADASPRATLRFEGLDPGGIVFLDGEEIARHEGMFVPFEVEIGDRLRLEGEHRLVVVVERAPPMPSQVSRTELARHHRSRMAYGWDFCPRLVQTGIWRSVRLELYEARLRDVRPTVDFRADDATGLVEVHAAVDGDADAVLARIVDPDGDVVASERAAVAGGQVRIGLEVTRPELWWPNRLGAPALYRLELALERDDVTLDERSERIGFRSVELRPTEGAPAGALPYSLTINGRPTWIRGWNWTPMDVCYGVPRPGRLRHLVELLRRANVNLLRVWGGGLIESEEFYAACDEAGILVWQEFIQSSSGVSNAPADDPEFVELMRREAEAIVPLRRQHPSLAIWCGGNELADADGRPLTDAHPVLAALRDVVTRLDRRRAWLPTSPTGPRFDNTLPAIAEDPASLHDVHGPWEHQGLAEQHALANATTSLLHSEFGVEGMTNLATLGATVTDPARHAADRTDPVMAHRGAWWNNKPFVERAFGGDLTLDELERASQHLQADGLRTLIEGDRRRWPRNAGTLPWVFNEPFPNAWSNAAVDYFGAPKAAYHAIAEAYAPILPGVTFETQALAGASTLTVTPWLVNDTDEPVDGPVKVALHDGFGTLLSVATAAVACTANAVATLEPVTLGLPASSGELLVLDVGAGGRQARYLLSRTNTLEPMRRLPPATVHATLRAEDEVWNVALRCEGPSAALELRLADARPVGWPERMGAAYLDTNLVTLLPGEERTVCVDWRDVAPDEQRLRLSGWNVAPRELVGG